MKTENTPENKERFFEKEFSSGAYGIIKTKQIVTRKGFYSKMFNNFQSLLIGKCLMGFYCQMGLVGIG